ncbi:MAG TPA: VWA domain-containing protein [Vicinamibacterales bacterium]
MRTLLVAASLLALAGPQSQPQVIRSGVTYVTTDLAVRNDRGQFVANLGKGDFDVYEDGVKQAIVTFVVSRGGRVLNETPPPAARQEGILLPPARPANDSSGRVLLIFIDDLHISPRDTPRVRDLVKQIATELVHDGDLFGIVSSGHSSIAIDMTYDRKRLDEAMKKIMGGGLMPSEIIGTPDGSQGPPEVRYKAHAAFSAAYEILQKLEPVHDRRKAFVYISSGYDFDPFVKSRAKASADRSGATSDSGQVPDTNPFSKTGNAFAAADLAGELSELTREANRANTAIYTIDPRGLVDGPDIDQTTLDTADWQDHVRETQSSLRVIAELTGGIAGVNTNNFTAALKRIDADTSDYYVLGYYSSNTDPAKKRRTIEIRVKPSDKRRVDKYQLSYKTSYTLKPPR